MLFSGVLSVPLSAQLRKDRQRGQLARLAEILGTDDLKRPVYLSSLVVNIDITNPHSPISPQKSKLHRSQSQDSKTRSPLSQRSRLQRSSLENLDSKLQKPSLHKRFRQINDKKGHHNKPTSSYDNNTDVASQLPSENYTKPSEIVDEDAIIARGMDASDLRNGTEVILEPELSRNDVTSNLVNNAKIIDSSKFVYDWIMK